MDPIERKLAQKCTEVWKLSGCGRLLLALSGGPDSTALFHALRLAEIPFEAAHCNFNLRGEESKRDRQFVEGLCAEYEIPLHVAEFDIPGCMEKGESVEMVCRRLRYDFFNQLTARLGFSRIAVAHNADDNIETFFLNALRGSGAKGLRGMQEDTGEIIRPFLIISRSEILYFLKTIEATYVTDSTNAESDYRRNYLRNNIFPLLREEWKGFDKAMLKTIELQRRDSVIVEHYLTKALEGLTDLLPWETVDKFPDPETLIYRFIKPFGGTSSIAAEMSRSYYKYQISNIKYQGGDCHVNGKVWVLSDSHRAVFTRKGILIESKGNKAVGEYIWEKISPADISLEKIKSCPADAIYLPFASDKYEWTEAKRDMLIHPLGMKGAQSVWKILKDAGLSVGQRENFRVLTFRETGEVIWVPGHKRSRLHLITDLSLPVYYLHRKE